MNRYEVILDERAFIGYTIEAEDGVEAIKKVRAMSGEDRLGLPHVIHHTSAEPLDVKSVKRES